MASPGFGFSVGDIIAGVEIAVKICKACRDTGGAPDQFHRVVLELEIYLSVLRRLQDVGCSAMPEVRTLAQFCEVPIQAFLAKIAKYEARFNSGSSSGRSYQKVVRAIKGLPRKAQWAVIASKEVEKLRAGLEAPLSALGLLLNLELSMSLPRFVYQCPQVQLQGSDVLLEQSVQNDSPVASVSKPEHLSTTDELNDGLLVGVGCFQHQTVMQNLEPEMHANNTTRRVDRKGEGCAQGIDETTRTPPQFVAWAKEITLRKLNAS